MISNNFTTLNQIMAMPDINKLLKQNNTGFKRYTGSRKTTFKAMLEAMQQHEVAKTKSARLSELSLEA